MRPLHSTTHPHVGRAGFAVMEMIVALAALAVVMLLVAQLATYCMMERLRISTRQAALEAAANVLEAARLETPESLTDAWAAARNLPAEDSNLPPESRLRVQMEAEKGVPGVRRVTVEVVWRFHADEEEQTVQLVGFFGPRSAAGGGK